MSGDGSGTRVALHGDYTYGLFQIGARASSALGVVSAFYLRSDHMQETADFSEVDYEFLNGKPSVPNGLWLNSFVGGQSSCERLVVPAQYQRVLNLTARRHAGNTWLTYGIHWLPDNPPAVDMP
jgi:beta-glucanase (GH16 family)